MLWKEHVAVEVFLGCFELLMGVLCHLVPLYPVRPDLTFRADISKMRQLTPKQYGWIKSNKDNWKENVWLILSLKFKGLFVVTDC